MPEVYSAEAIGNIWSHLRDEEETDPREESRNYAESSGDSDLEYFSFSGKKL